ncbi:hypothetical protein G4B88_001585 [Cannabis sativa]|uniref:Uncharacterized protein n=1 Tax=Cannabis sativa TaxID=3483 RepID=A0A7J6I2W7_CANSA|nr:hypothetical protein G4B88_001585 [Cannabis sativa]
MIEAISLFLSWVRGVGKGCHTRYANLLNFGGSLLKESGRYTGIHGKRKEWGRGCLGFKNWGFLIMPCVAANGDVLSAKVGSCLSVVWRRLLWGHEIILEVSMMGLGEQVRIVEDR